MTDINVAVTETKIIVDATKTPIAVSVVENPIAVIAQVGGAVTIAAEIVIADAGGYYTGKNVELALQEIGAGTTLDGRYLLESNNLSDLDSDSTARTNLGVAIGSDVLAYDAGIQNLAGVAMQADRFYYTSADNVHVAGVITVAGRALIDDANAAAQRTTLGLVAGGAGDIWVEKAGDTMIGANSLTFFQIQQLDTTPVLNVDTVNGRIALGRDSLPLGKLDIASGKKTLIMGADANIDNIRTDATTKQARIGVAPYTNAQIPTALFYVGTLSTASALSIGGGTSTFNAVTRIQFYTAADTTTPSGTEVMRIDHTQRISVGHSTPQGKVHVKGTADDQIFIIQAYAAQIANIVEVWDGSNNVGFAIEPDFDVIIGYGAPGKDYTLTFNGETNDGVVTWMEDEDYFKFGDDVSFADGAGLYFGNMYTNSTITVTITDTTPVEVGDTFTAGEFNGVSFGASHYLDVGADGAGKYRVEWDISASQNTPSSAIEIECGVMIDGVAQSGGRGHRTVSNSTDVGSISGHTILDLAASKQVSLFIINETNGTDIDVEHANLTITMIGGT